MLSSQSSHQHLPVRRPHGGIGEALYQRHTRLAKFECHHEPNKQSHEFMRNEVSGKVIKILVDDNSPIEFDQPLFEVEPS